MSQDLASYGGISKPSAGAKYDLRPDTVITRLAEEAIPFGVAVTSGTAEGQCTVVDNAADAFIGVALATHTVENGANASDNEYAINAAVSVLEKGACYVELTSDVAQDAAAYVDVSDGKFTDVSTDNLAVPGGFFETSGVDGGTAVLKII